MNNNQTLFGKQHVIIKEENAFFKITESKWVDAKLYEKDNCIKLEFLKDIQCKHGQTLILGEFEQDEEIKKLFLQKDRNNVR